MKVLRYGICCSIWRDYLLKWGWAACSTAKNSKCTNVKDINQNRWYVSVPTKELFTSVFADVFHTSVWARQTKPYSKKLVVLEYRCKTFFFSINFLWLFSTGEMVSFRIYIFKLKCILEINFDWTVILWLFWFRLEVSFVKVLENFKYLNHFLESKLLKFS